MSGVADGVYIGPEDLVPAAPPCPFWADGVHGYQVMWASAFVDGHGIVRPRPESDNAVRVKVCACGAQVKPRET